MIILEETTNVYVNNIKDYDFASLDWKCVQNATRQDSMLCKMMCYVLDG